MVSAANLDQALKPYKIQGLLPNMKIRAEAHCGVSSLFKELFDPGNPVTRVTRDGLPNKGDLVGHEIPLGGPVSGPVAHPGTGRKNAGCILSGQAERLQDRDVLTSKEMAVLFAELAMGAVVLHGEPFM